MPSMCNILALNPAVQKQILRQARHRHFDAAALFRLRLVLAVASGRSRRCVAAVCSCAASTCIRAVERFEQGGFEALQDQRCHNGQSKLSLAYLETLHAVVDLRADAFGWQRPIWTREALALTMSKEEQPAVLRALRRPCYGVSRRSDNPCDSGQLRHSHKWSGPAKAPSARRQDRAALSASVLSRPQPHRARVARAARQRDTQPSLQVPAHAAFLRGLIPGASQSQRRHQALSAHSSPVAA